MPSKESSAEHYQRLKVGNLESSKRDHFRPDPVPFDRPLTLSSKPFEQTQKVEQPLPFAIRGFDFDNGGE